MQGFIWFHTGDAHNKSMKRNPSRGSVHPSQARTDRNSPLCEKLLVWIDQKLWFSTYMLAGDDRETRGLTMYSQYSESEYQQKWISTQKRLWQIQTKASDGWILSICNDVSISEGWFAAHAFVLLIEEECFCQKKTKKNKPTLGPKVQCHTVFPVTLISAQHSNCSSELPRGFLMKTQKKTHRFHPGSRQPHRELCKAETDSGSSSLRSHGGGSSPEVGGTQREAVRTKAVRVYFWNKTKAEGVSR